jgi:flagellar motor switch protein FliM
VVRDEGADLRRHDFSARPTLTPEAMVSLRAASTTLAKRWSTTLSVSLREACAVTVTRLVETRLSDVLHDMNAPAVLSVLEVQPLSMPGLLVLPRLAALVCVDRMLGGGGAIEQVDRPLTDLDTALFSHLVSGFATEVAGGFEVLGLTRCRLERFIQHDPAPAADPSAPGDPATQATQATQATPTTAADAPAENADDAEPLPLDMVLSIGLDLVLGPVVLSGSLCLAGPSVARQLQGSAVGRPEPTEPVQQDFYGLLTQALQPVPVDVSVRFRPTTLSPVQLFTLAVGDVLPLAHPVSTPLAVTAGGAVLAHAVPGAEGQHLAVLIVEPSSLEAAPW